MSNSLTIVTLYSAGQRQKEIVAVLGVSPQLVHNTLNEWLGSGQDWNVKPPRAMIVPPPQEGRPSSLYLRSDVLATAIAVMSGPLDVKVSNTSN